MILLRFLGYLNFCWNGGLGLRDVYPTEKRMNCRNPKESMMRKSWTWCSMVLFRGRIYSTMNKHHMHTVLLLEHIYSLYRTRNLILANRRWGDRGWEAVFFGGLAVSGYFGKLTTVFKDTIRTMEGNRFLFAASLIGEENVCWWSCWAQGILEEF